MPLVWLSKVEAPEEVLPNVSFKISWKECFFIFPFKSYRIVSRIYKNDSLWFDRSYTIKHWWFFGSYTHNISGLNIDKDTTYRVEVGYGDI